MCMRGQLNPIEISDISWETKNWILNEKQTELTEIQEQGKSL